MKALHDCHILVTATSYGQHDAGLRRELEAAVGRVTYNETGRPLSSSQLAALLQSSGMMAYLVRRGDNLTAVFSQSFSRANSFTV